MPKDEEGTTSAYPIVDFDGQRRKTKTRLANKLLFITPWRKGVFSQIKGEIGIKVFYVDDEATPKPADFAAEQKIETAEEKPPENPKPEEEKSKKKKAE
ncbi:hypothetical protein V6N11_056238 [Hibiscus sabdariffa]|uniref:Uncharacterized protein n=1 Tax=Hibiscus sabdariffa TaxID=183260 RepID=A0ABR2T373_9ROSI